MLSRYTTAPIGLLAGAALADTRLRSPKARIAEEAGAAAVMALERVPADIRAQGGVARMSDPKMIKEIMDTVTIPVMAKARIGHFVECQVRAATPNPFAAPAPASGFRFSFFFRRRALRSPALATVRDCL